jgi:DNA polymerase III subunit epsilon
MNDAAASRALDGYRHAFERTWGDATPLDAVRFVVLDTEATGPDAARDRIISIGAVAVVDGQIDLSDCFEALLKVSHNQSSVTVHGITRDEARGGMDEPEALLAFLDYLRDGVIVGHHIGFDVQMMSRACEQHFGIRIGNRSVDTMDLTLHLQDSGAFAGREGITEFSLDTLCTLFGVEPRDRHTAGGDAFITAQIFLRLLRLAKRHGRGTLGEVCVPYPVEPPARR